MKRTHDQISSSLQPPALNRQQSMESIDAENDNSNNFLLVSQNKALSLELIQNKKTIAEARKELDLMRRKSQEMQSLVSIIQRAWSQLDIDASMLLDNLGDSEVQIPSDGSSELLHRLIHAGSEYMLSDPTKLEPPQICADQWSSEEEINQEKERLEKANAASDLLNNEFGGHVEENLAAHASFTLSLLERLCNALSDSVSIQMTDQDLNRIAEDKKFHAEKLLLSDRITKLNGEIIQLNSKIIVLENQKSRISRKLAQTHQQLLEARELVAKSQTASNSSNNGDSTTVGQPPLSSPSAPNGSNSDVEKELKRQIAMLERQLTESESAKSKVEMTLTERLARPLSQTEAQVADMRKAMEDLRQQCKQRVSTLVTEVISLHEKVANLELALDQVEKTSKQTIDKIVKATESEIKKVKDEKDKLQSSLNMTKNDKLLLNTQKKHLADFYAVEKVWRSDIKKLEQQLKTTQQSLVTIHTDFKQSLKREVRLEKFIGAKFPDEKFLLKNGKEYESMEEVNKSKELLEAGEIPYVDESIQVAELTLLAIVQQSAERIEALSKDLESDRNTINDLIVEIDSISSGDSKYQEQCSQLLVSLTELQGKYRNSLDENSRLEHRITELKNSYTEIEDKMETIKKLHERQDQIVPNLRASEQQIRSEYLTLKNNYDDLQEKHQNDLVQLEEVKQNVSDIKHTLSATLKRNEELQSRCDELTSQCEAERKLRMEAQRELKNKLAKKEKEVSRSSSDPINSEDKDMLEMTLGMLRCSVCKDRFKSVALTRCFHLFCKDCIDENIRNRSRKCPACGERFGQDDVRNIYFTH